MRIRKRKVPLPISSLSPVPICSSDPNLPLVQLQPDRNPPRNLFLRPPDHSSQPSGAGVEVVKDLPEEDGKKRGEFGGEKMMRKSNDSREGSGQLGAEIECTVLEQPDFSRDKAGGRWFEGENVFPLKKRRGSVERRSSSDHEDDKKMKTKVKNLESRSGKGVEDGDKEEEVIGLATDGARKKRRGGAILEGSRCSRVNGRGWRCCQQTLVGYSLCEHHLGKGRLRSMSNVSRNNRSKAGKLLSSSSLENSLMSPEEDQGTKTNGSAMVEDEKKPAIIVRRKTGKLGIFKARSLSSLLGLANEAISMAENET